MNSDIEDIKSRLNIVDIIGEYIRLDKAGANYKARCPFHNEKTPSFMASEEKQIWHCFGCQKGGDVFSFVMEMEGLEFKETIKLLADKAGINLSRFDSKTEGKKNRTLEILELATKFYETQLWKGAGKDRIINYLKERGLKEEIIREFRLGYAPAGWRNLLTFLTGRGYAIEEIAKTGLLVEKIKDSEIKKPDYYDRFRDRIIFPVADTMSKVVGMSARVAPGGDESQAKYVNTPESEVYHKSKVLYGIDKAKSEIKRKDYVLLVEGNMDVIAASQAGIKNAVAVSGTALTGDQLSIIKRYTPNIKMFFDMDKAGEEATKKSIKLCFERDMNVKVVELPEGKDAADLARSNPELLKKAVRESPDAMEYFFQKVFSKYGKEKPNDQKKIASEILDMVSGMYSEIVKSHWIKKLANELNVKEIILTDLLKKIIIKGRSTEEKKEEVPDNLPKSKLDMLIQNLIGMMLIYGEVWQKASSEETDNPILLNNRLLATMLRRGEEFQYKMENLIKNLELTEDVASAEKIFFENRYRLDLNNNIEEIILEQPFSAYAERLKEIKREVMKGELERIEKDLKTAEDQKDREAAVFLRQEVKRISSELSN